ncbi:hypothetical protein [Streptomyces caniscabiei]|uniref:Uncharacterized protein n=1 Tax=Streptomyces caniscabiei TaxID=2746961 RepID=A0ABU4MZS3_9ACTN|nr:hypothetical protein [Streptomyces caniscabiei]MBE4790322.1 hypothetical protein [Streptomyces caniscabiei]MBE4799449.1 hypothetical protein [Streptomyces caniscabiei]MDX3015179.1 hypothetical protein [Streptomyces caniscabiei]MDX3042622.1 hypothetical protein [Streptomyces caniscabiei]
MPYFPPRMRTPGTYEVYSSDGRHGGTVSSQIPRADIDALLTHLNEVEPDAGWTWEYIPLAPQTGGK